MDRCSTISLYDQHLSLKIHHQRQNTVTITFSPQCELHFQMVRSWANSKHSVALFLYKMVCRYVSCRCVDYVTTITGHK